jgi:hypothetical protein
MSLKVLLILRFLDFAIEAVIEFLELIPKCRNPRLTKSVGQEKISK